MALNKPTKIITHHFGGSDLYPLSDSSNLTAQDVDVWHKARWPGFTSKLFKNDKGKYYHVGYHFIIEKNGKLVQCRGVDEEGAHVIGQNLSSIGVSFAGNFDVTMPTKAQENTFRILYKKLHEMFPAINSYNIYPHRSYATKTCHGLNLTDDYFSKLISDTENPFIINDLQMRIIQLLTSLRELLTNKRYSNKQVK